MQKWYVLQVFSTHEKKIKKALEDQRDKKGMANLIEEVLIPTENVSEVVKGVQKVLEKKLWPGYILVKMTLNDDSWTQIKNTPGVIDFLGGTNPQPLSDDEVSEILQDLKDKKESITQKHKFEVGDPVKIVDGVFINFIGTVTDIQYDKGKLSVMLNIFGRDTQVDDLDFLQVEEISDEESKKL